MRSTLTAAAAALTALALAGCSSAIAGVARPDQDRPHAPAASAPYPSPKHRPPAATSAPAGSSDVDQALLVATDLGPGYAASTPDPPSALPCTPGLPPVDDQLAHVEKGNAVYVDDVAGTQVSEQIYVYRTPAQALRHQAVLEAGLACRHGTSAGRPVMVLGPSDVRRQLRLHTDAAQVWIVHTGRISAALVALRIHAVVVQFAVVTEDSSTSQPNVKKVVIAGLTKLYAVARG